MAHKAWTGSAEAITALRTPGRSSGTARRLKVMLQPVDDGEGWLIASAAPGRPE